MTSLGRRFTEALAAKDDTALRSVLADDVDFLALTPRRSWEAQDSGSVLEILLGSWFEPDDEITGVLDVSENPPVEDTAHVGYRFAITTPDGAHVAEQQAYYRADGDRISYLRIMCSGFRPAAS